MTVNNNGGNNKWTIWDLFAGACSKKTQPKEEKTQSTCYPKYGPYSGKTYIEPSSRQDKDAATVLKELAAAKKAEKTIDEDIGVSLLLVDPQKYLEETQEKYRLKSIELNSLQPGTPKYDIAQREADELVVELRKATSLLLEMKTDKNEVNEENEESGNVLKDLAKSEDKTEGASDAYYGGITEEELAVANAKLQKALRGSGSSFSVNNLANEILAAESFEDKFFNYVAGMRNS